MLYNNVMGDKVITTWRPDTCGCVLNYSWDRESSEDGRVHTYEGHNLKCHNHGHLMEQHFFETVLEENQRKNITLQHALDNVATKKLARQIKIGLNNTGPEVNVKKDDVEYNWFYAGDAPNRVLHVSFSEPLTDEEKKIIESKFPGKVKVF